MKKTFSLFIVTALAAGMLLGCAPVAQVAPSETATTQTTSAPVQSPEPSSAASAETDPYQAFYDCVDPAYSLGVMEKLRSFTTNDDLGFRTAGSSAELAAGDYLVSEFEAIGLANVHKDEVTVDKWEFKNADLTYQGVDGADTTIELAAFHVQYAANDEELTLVYAGKGTEADYEKLNVQDKIVLVDIDQLNEWWINWPAYQAKVKGAKAIIAVNVDGYCTYSEDTVGVQDLCGPEDAPAFSISVAQADALKAAIESVGGELSVKLNADSVVKRNGTSYNIVGEIPGKSDEVIYLIGHYDSYFRAFDDNTSGIGAMAGILRALVMSGYQPQKTIRAVAHCAEEWGVADSRYDWARGAAASAEKHPEWADSAFMMINIDGGSIDGGSKGYKITTPYELADAVLTMGQAVEGSPLPEELIVNSPIWTWTEEFAYSQLGIPTLASGMYGASHTASYHSSSDTKEANRYSDEVFAFSQKLYGSYLISFDKLLVRPIEYIKLFDAMGESVRAETIEDAQTLLDALAKAGEAADKLSEKAAAVSAQDAPAFNTAVNKLNRLVQNNMYTLDWNEEYQFVHEYKQNNVEYLEGAIAALKAGDAALALDEYLWQIDLNWYAYAFDKATCDYFAMQVLGDDARNSWGGTYVQSNADLLDVIRSLQNAKEGASFDAQIAALEKELATQKDNLKAVVQKEIADLVHITSEIEALAK